jgi:pimeloyl-ACP methyl ester carboxylesterase
VQYVVGGVPVHYVEQGEGSPLLALHGAGVDHREVMACLEPVFDALTGHRRIYVDLPGMGLTPAPETISSADDVLDVLLEFIEGVIGDQPLLVAGHSAGGYYAQAIADRRPEQVVGLALLCPLFAGVHDVPDHDVVVGSGDIGSDEFRDYFTVQTALTLDRYERYVEPAARLADQSALARIGARWELTSSPALPHEQPELLRALVTEWLDRVREHASQ